MVAVVFCHAAQQGEATSFPSTYMIIEFKKNVLADMGYPVTCFQKAVSKQGICERKQRDFLWAYLSVVSHSYVFSVPPCWSAFLLILSAQALLATIDNSSFLFNLNVLSSLDFLI